SPSFLRADQPLYEPKAVSQPQMQRRGYSVTTWVSLLGIAAACTAMLIMFAKPLWHSLSAQRDTGSEAPSLRLSGPITVDSVPAGGVARITATHEAQQPSSLQAQPGQLPRIARQSEQNPTDSSVRGVTDNEIRFGISAPFSGAAKELGQNMKLGID